MDEAKLLELIGKVVKDSATQAAREASKEAVQEAISELKEWVANALENQDERLTKAIRQVGSELHSLRTDVTGMDGRLSNAIQSLKVDMTDMDIRMSMEFRNVKATLYGMEDRLTAEVRARMQVEKAAFGDSAKLQTAVKALDRRVKVLETK